MDPVRRNVRLYYAFSFFSFFLIWGGIWIKYLIEDRGLELRWILAMDLPFWLLVALLQAPTGALADYIGRKRVLALSGLLYSATILGFGLTSNYWMLFFDYIIWAVAMTTQTGANDALLYDTLKEHNREGEYQKYVGRGWAIGLGAGLGGVVLGGMIAHVTSLAFTVQIGAVAPLIAMLAALAMREPRREVSESRHYWRDLSGALRFAWATPQVRYTLLVGSVLMTGTFGPIVLIQPFLIEYDVSNVLFGWAQAPLRLVSVVASLVALRIITRLGMSRLLVVACVLVFTSYVGLGATGSIVAFGFFALPALAQGVVNPAVSGHLNSRIPSDRRATVLSCVQLLFAAQVAFFEPALGFFADGLSLAWAFWFCALYFAVLMPPLLFLWRRAHRAPGDEGGVAELAPAPA
ncbi:MAG: MFS transporter [Dehalococcoidia bacterium]|nr:MFS transporter [Dehalococcoidia bacterium]MCB9485106.1 MFS transporter [Thermoflexaceae bacterium]